MWQFLVSIPGKVLTFARELDVAVLGIDTWEGFDILMNSMWQFLVSIPGKVFIARELDVAVLGIDTWEGFDILMKF
jgi:hypothetical protein